VVAGPGPSIQATLRGVATFVAPTSLVTALLFYFGWTRTSYQARVMGLDDSLLGFSTQDYILNSISSMYWPLFSGAVAVLVAVVAHGLLTSWLDGDPSRPAVVRTVAGIAAAGTVLLVLGALGAQDDSPSRFVSWAAPLAVTVSIVLLGYAAYLTQARLLDGRRRVTATVGTLAPWVWAMATALVLLSLFWTVSHYAGVRGTDLAVAVEKAVPNRPSVTIYSPTRLHLQPPVKEVELADEKGAYRFVYSDLKLLFRSGGRFFLRPADTSVRRNIVIADSPDLRFEFEPRTRARRDPGADEPGG
jgi:hypothetical protein